MRASAWFLVFVGVACTAAAPGDEGARRIKGPGTPEIDEGGSSGTDGVVGFKVSSITLNHISENRPAWVETRTFDSPLSAEQAWASVQVAADEVLAVAMRGESGEIVDAQFVSDACEYSLAPEPATLTVPTDYASIQAALDAAGPHDTVRVLAGTYYERLRLRGGVRLIGAGARDTILDGEGRGENLIDFTNARDAVVSGFTLRNVGRREGCSRPLDALACAGGWYASAVYADGHGAQDDDPCKTPSLYFSDNIVSDNDIGMMLYFRPYAVVRDNVFVGNRVGFAANHHGGATALLAWNVFYQNADEALAVSASFLDILSNVFLENGSVLRQDYCQRGRLRCNVLWQNDSLGDRVFSGSEGNLFSDPLLSPVDYSLDPSSPVHQTECASETQIEGDDAGGLSTAPTACGETEAGEGCFSPLRPPTSFVNDLPGCACVETDGEQRGYCLEGIALVCAQGHWQHVVDGPCFPSPSVGSGWCASGALTTAETCPRGFGQRSAAVGVDAGSEGQLCCLPVEVTPGECMEAGFRLEAAGAQSSLLETRCSGDRALRAFVPGDNPSLCCE